MISIPYLNTSVMLEGSGSALLDSPSLSDFTDRNTNNYYQLKNLSIDFTRIALREVGTFSFAFPFDSSHLNDQV